jgi:hypothetical protein
MNLVNLRLAFVTALLMALLTVLISAIFGKKVAWVIGMIGTLSVLLPLILIVVLGVSGILENSEGVGQVASDTISNIVRYMRDHLPGLVISAVAGAVVGFILNSLKKITPKRIRKKVAKRIRI